MNRSLYLDRAVLHFDLAHIADLAHHSDITLEDVPNREYTLKLFAEDQEIEVQETGARSWTPAQPQYAHCFFTTYTH